MGKKILILYEKMGMGHLRMAEILHDILKGDGTEFVKMAGSDLVDSSDVNAVVKIWNTFIRKNWIKAVDILLNFLARILVIPAEEAGQVRLAHDRLEKMAPDIIICTADMYSKLLGGYASEKRIPFYLFITDLSLFIDLVNPYAVHLCYFKDTAAAIRSYDFKLAYYSFPLDRSTRGAGKLKYILGYYRDFLLGAYKNSVYRDISQKLKQKNDARVEVIGPLVESRHYVKKDPLECRRRLGITNNDPVVLAASGSIGGKMLLNITRIICRSSTRKINLLAMCGNDRQVYEKISSMQEPSGPVNLMAFSYVRNFEDFLCCADCIILRPSAGIFLESLVHRVPAIALCPVTSNDRGTLGMIEKYQVGGICKKKTDLAKTLSGILDNKSEYRDNIDSLLREYPSTYEEIREKIRDLICNVADNTFC